MRCSIPVVYGLLGWLLAIACASDGAAGTDRSRIYGAQSDTGQTNGGQTNGGQTSGGQRYAIPTNGDGSNLSHADSATGGVRAYASDHEARRWRGVGVLSVDGGVCTGALIAPDVVLTAAHCVADYERKTVFRPAQVKFYAGWQDRRAIAVRQAVRISIHPGYFAAGGGYSEARIRTDVAQVRLDRPIPKQDAPAYRVSFTPDIGAAIALVGYSADRLQRVSVQAPCRLLDRKTEFIRSSCRSDPGASGSPIFEINANGDARIVALNTGTRTNGRKRSALGLTLDHVRDWLATGGAAAVSNGFKRVKPGSGGARGSRTVQP